MMRIERKQLDEAEIVGPTDRQTAKLDQARAISRRQQALLAAAGEAVPDRRWYVLLIGRDMDNAVDNALTNASIEHWMPVVMRKPKRRSHRRHQQFCPVGIAAFPGLMFVRAQWTAYTWEALSSLAGVFDVVGGAACPAPVIDKEFNGFRSRAENDPEFLRRLVGALAIGDFVRIDHGPFDGFAGVVTMLRKGGRLRVETMLLGQEVPVDLTVAQVTKLD